jgi:hypothetical protein
LGKGEGYRHIVSLAADKINRGKELALRSRERAENSDLAAAMIIYSLLLKLHAGLSESLTASHMAILQKVSESREVLAVHYPGEPILVLVAFNYFQWQ